MVNDYDDIDKLFQDNLDPDIDSTSVWNDPGQDIFLSAMEQVDKKDDDRIIPLFWLPRILGITVLIVSALTIYYIANIKTKPTSKTDLSQTIQPSIEDNSKIASFFSSTKPAILEGSELKNSESGPMAASRTSSTPAANKTNIVFKTPLLKDQYGSPISTGEDTVESDKGIINTIMDLPVQRTSTITPYIGTIIAPNISLSKEDLISDHSSTSSLIIKNRSSLRYFISPLLHSSSFGMNNPSLRNAELTKYDKYYLGGSIQLGVEQDLRKNWKVQYSAGYQYLENKSLYKQEITFDEDLVANMGGLQRNYITSINIADPTGIFREDFDAIIQKNILQDDDIMKQKSHIRSEFHIINLGANGNYHISLSSEWTSFIGIGIDVNYIVSAERTVETDLYKKTEIVMADKLISTSTVNHRSFNFGLSPMAGIRYHIDAKWDISLLSSYHIGLTPINKMNTSSIGEAFLRDWRTGLQVGYRF
jgi:hypothetical protein